ncbi:MAG: hypothetical protein FWH15_08270 [Betaproteobacteria bacterium]|nr:hypothetical protein [Betaproteobacteria bacterium]
MIYQSVKRRYPMRSLADRLITLAKAAFGIGLFILALTWLFADDLPSPAALLPALAQEPIQKPTSALPFTTNFDGISYQVKPLHEYELWGLVVSMHHSDSWWDSFHRNTGDFLNVVDLCVVWGKSNALSGLYEKLSFSSGQFTCYYKTSDRETWERFVNEEISNNHILATDYAIKRRIKDVRVGDQIHFRGYLAEYSNSKGMYRSTSTARTDTGPGACETVFIETFEVLRRGPRLWLNLRRTGVALILASILFVLVFVCLPGRFHGEMEVSSP